MTLKSLEKYDLEKTFLPATFVPSKRVFSSSDTFFYHKK